MAAVCSPTYGLTSSGPLVITGSNKTISAKRISSSSGHCMEIRGARNIVIEGSVIGACKGNGIYIVNSHNIEIRRNFIEDVQSGVYAVNSTRINVHHNRFLNMKGPFPRGQYVQFNNVDGGGNRINYNEGESRLGESYPEDLVNLYRSKGAASDPIQIIGNRFKGGGPSKSGGGIMSGDNDGGNVVVRDNILVDPGQYGIAIAGGDDITIENNRVYGRQQSFTNVGIYVWRQKNTDSCRGHRVADNQVRYYNKNGQLNSAWNAGNCGSVSGWNTNDWHADLGAWVYEGLGVDTLLDASPGQDSDSGSDNDSGNNNDTDDTDEQPTASIRQLQLVDTSTGSVLGSLTDNSRWVTEAKPLAVVAITSDFNGYVHLNLQGPRSHYQTERFVPYTLFGDSAGQFTGFSFPAGNYRLSVTLKNAAGATLGDSKSVSFQITDSADEQTVFRHMELVDAATNRYVGIVRDGDSLSISGRQVTIKAINEQPVDEVRFQLKGPVSYSRTERVAPYALFGDSSGDFNGRELASGNYQLTVSAIKNGQVLEDMQIQFRVN
ncbi:MAG: right-handed parallel beta-helix repeat-containing protein [Ketobacteraceae bacterium]|nr:right-handed parallel beta-helix repeat-containing protein [Ketobacteraceae bacterium]